MTISEMIHALEDEQTMIADAISRLRELEQMRRQNETYTGALRPAHHRGRKVMAPEERKAVSERMHRYWNGVKARAAEERKPWQTTPGTLSS